MSPSRFPMIKKVVYPIGLCYAKRKNNKIHSLLDDFRKKKRLFHEHPDA